MLFNNVVDSKSGMGIAVSYPVNPSNMVNTCFMILPLILLGVSGPTVSMWTHLIAEYVQT